MALVSLTNKDADEGDIVNESEGSDEGDGNAFAELMRPKVRIGTRLPFILQVSLEAA
jgi:hypothetical protein